MTKQTVCIVGDGLTAHITALALDKLNLKTVDKKTNDTEKKADSIQEEKSE